LDDLENRKFFTLMGIEIRPVGHPARTDYAIPGLAGHNGTAAGHRTWLIVVPALTADQGFTEITEGKPKKKDLSSVPHML
jgi:hypothetical protein